MTSLSLSTPRLTIAPLTLADLDAFVAYRRDPDVARYQSWEESFTHEDGRAMVAAQPADLPPPGGWIQLALHAEDHRLVGDVAIHTLVDQPDSYELGVTLAPEAQGAGLATEAMTAVLLHLFSSRSAHRVVASCDARNQPVAQLLRRVGMRHESRQVDADWFKGEWTTLDGYAVLGREWIR